MTEDEARNWIRIEFGEAALSLLARYVDLLLAESAQQSLIARSTFGSVWTRHIVDSAQLVRLAPDAGCWMDIGSGGGLPGVVVAALRRTPMVMVEPRRKRVEFLRNTCSALGLENATVLHANVQATELTAEVVSARAVASLSDVFQWTQNVVSRETLFLLPRGENAVTDLDVVRRAWQGTFHVKQSITNPAAGIVVADGVRPR